MKTLKLTMHRELDVYKCPLCENLVEIIDPHGVGLVCCGRSMIREVVKKAKIGMYPHSIIIAKTYNGVHVSVGRPLHPMDDEHRILWIELIAHDKIVRQVLRPGDFPAAIFNVPAERISVRAYCNEHGLWSCLASDFKIIPITCQKADWPVECSGPGGDRDVAFRYKIS